MIPAETIRSILNDAVQAPSGENAQPWRFEVAGNTVILRNVPDEDRSLYNFEQRAAYISHGAVIENISIAAHYRGIDIRTEILPDANDKDLVARITFVQREDAGDNHSASYYDLLAKRTTNRKIYKGGIIPPEVMQKIEKEGGSDPLASAKFMTSPETIQRIAAAATVNDIILLENKPIHDFFFQHVHWTLAEEEEKRTGFYIEVLELAPPVKALFRLFRYWKIMRIFNALGAARKGARENEKIYASASAMGAIMLEHTDPASFVAAGIALQRIWLAVTANGLSLQPLTGVLFFHQRFAAGQDAEFSSAHKELIEAAYKEIEDAFAANGKTLAMMFRIGYADAPTASSLKKAPQIIIR